MPDRGAGSTPLAPRSASQPQQAQGHVVMMAGTMLSRPSLTSAPSSLPQGLGSDSDSDDDPWTAPREQGDPYSVKKRVSQ